MKVKFEKTGPKRLKYNEIGEGETFIAIDSEPYVHMKSDEGFDMQLTGPAAGSTYTYSDWGSDRCFMLVDAVLVVTSAMSEGE